MAILIKTEPQVPIQSRTPQELLEEWDQFSREMWILNDGMTFPQKPI